MGKLKQGFVQINTGKEKENLLQQLDRQFVLLALI
jgi:hypothetical protein